MKITKVTPLTMGTDWRNIAEAFVKDAADGLPEVIDGYFTLPDTPGLGLTLNEDVIAEHPQRELHFNLYAEDWQKRSVKKKE